MKRTPVATVTLALLRTPVLYPLRDALLSAGFAMAASYAHGDNMGNQASLDDQVLLLRDAEKKLPPLRAVDLVGFSMGGLDALMEASRHMVTGLSAVVVLSGMCDQIPFLGSVMGKSIVSAFGGKTGEALLEAIGPYDPAKQDPRSYSGYKYWFWQSPTDHTVPPVQAASMTAILESARVPVQLSLLDGNHGDLSKLQPQQIVQYFQS